jgi:phosphatidylglycerophosphate synthase
VAAAVTQNARAVRIVLRCARTMLSLRSLPLERLGQLQAVLVLVACPLVAVAVHPWPLAVAAACGLALLLAAQRGRYTPGGSFGSANAVTASRFAAVLGLAVLGLGLAPLTVAMVAVGAMLLDSVDGFLARRSGKASAFGAHFDVEVDALLVLVLGAVLWQRERLGAWILWPGLLRYLYVLVLAVAPARGLEPRSWFGRLAFGAVVAGLVGAFLDAGRLGSAAAVCGAAVVTVSFGRSFYFSYGKSAR